MQCTTCLNSYVLNNAICVLPCAIDDTCSTVGAKVIPLPGFITVVLWIALVCVLKFIVGKLYVAYSTIMVASLAEVAMLIASLTTLFSTLNATNARLLLTVDHSYRVTVELLFIVALAFNYLCNFVYVCLYIRYIKPLITNPRQIDILTNTLVLVTGTLTNFRFAILPFSKMFPKPHIQITISSQLTPIHYLCIVAIILDALPVTGCCLLLYNELPLTNLFMLALDYLLIIIVNLFLTIWMTSVKKDDNYF